MNMQKSGRKNVELDFYGLTGAGLQFRNTPIKVLCRDSRYKEIIEEAIKPAAARLKMGDPINKLFIADEIKEMQRIERRRLLKK